jgi:hypothetical protein
MSAPVGEARKAAARQLVLLPRQAVVAALQQRPEQLGRERVARHAHHSPGRADLLLHRHEQVGLELVVVRVPLVDRVPPVLLRAQQVAAVVAAAAAARQRLGGVATVVAPTGLRERVWARPFDAQQSANSSLSTRKSLA